MSSAKILTVESLKQCDPERQRLLKLALRAARAGRAELLKYFGRLGNIEHKFQAGLVTEADRAAEAAIFSVLRAQTPDADFLGEESVVGPIGASPKDLRWLVDPLDGTTNYVHQFPFFGVSIGLEFKGELIAGVVDAPMLGEVYCGLRGGGSYLNGKRLGISKCSTLADAFIATGFHAEVEEIFSEQVRVFDHVARKVRAARRAGSAALDLCYVARGIFDFYYERNLQPWDSAAGILILEEAGGIATTFRGAPASPYGNSIAAGPRALVEDFTREVTPLLLSKTH